MLPALIGAGASLLGGIFGRNSEKKAIAAQNAYNDPAQIRARAEAAGFNPLLFVGPGVGNQMTTGGANYMGSAIADAGMQIADQMSKNRELARLEKLSAENKKLAEKVQNLTIRPKVGGVYAQREAYNAGSSTSDVRLRGVSARVDGMVASGASATGNLRPLPATSPIDERRDVDHKPVPSSSGFVVVDNPHLDYPVYIPSLDGDETMGPDYITVPLAYWGSGVYDRYNKNQSATKRPSTDRLGTPANNPWKKAFSFPQLTPPKLNLGARYGG